MARFSINEMTTYRWSFEEDVHYCAATGIESLGVWRQKLSDFGEEKGVELLLESGMSVSSLLWAGGFTGSDGRSHKEAVADARDALHLAAELKAECLIVYSGTRAGHTRSHANRLLRSAITNLLPIAGEFGIPLAIEPVPATCGDGWSFLSSIEETQAFLDEFDSPLLQLVFDTYHFGREEGIAERLPELASRIAIVQLADGKQSPRGEQNRCMLGEGTIPLSTIVSQLLRGGYGGVFDVKLMGEEIEACDYAELVAHSKRVFDELTAAASV
jgi:sugar phosphate isomerase/epimerase